LNENGENNEFFKVLYTMFRIFYFTLTVSKFLGATVSTLNPLCMELAKSKHLEFSPWLMITFFGLGSHFATKFINWFLEECPENPSTV